MQLLICNNKLLPDILVIPNKIVGPIWVLWMTGIKNSMPRIPETM